MKHALKFLWFFLALTGLAGCAQNPVTGQRDFVLMSEDQEIALGRQTHAQVLEQMGRYDNPELNAYVQRIGEQLAEHSHRPGLIYRFTVLDSADVNAFALPGGYIYITRGLLAYLNSEAEVAAVLGHEIGHVTARHSVRQHSTATATGILGAVIAGASGVPGAGDLANVAGTAIVRGYGREHELEADRLGAEYLARTGYDPQAMLKVIGVLKDQENFERKLAAEEGREPRIYHGLFSTHPDNDQRLQEVVGAAGQLSANGHRMGRDAYLDEINGLVFGDSAAQGIRRGNRFYHAELDFTLRFPDGWKLENLPDRLDATPPTNDALLRFQMTDINRRIEPREFIKTRLNIDNLEHGEAIELNGMPGYTGLVERDTQRGPTLIRLVVLYRNDKALIFSGFTEQRDQPYRYDPLYLDTAKSFRRLKPEERALAEPQRIQVIKATAGTRFADLARTSSIPNYPEAQLRLLNGLYPDGEPAAGERIKTVK